MSEEQSDQEDGLSRPADTAMGNFTWSLYFDRSSVSSSVNKRSWSLPHEVVERVTLGWPSAVVYTVPST